MYPCNKMTNKNNIPRMVPKSNRKIVYIVNRYPKHTNTWPITFFTLAIGTSIKSGGIKPNI